MSAHWRVLGWLLLAAAVAACCGFFGWESVLMVVPLVVAIGVSLARRFNGWAKRYADRSLQREFAKYQPDNQGRIVPRSRDGVPQLLLQLGVGARDRLRIASHTVSGTRPATVHMPQPGRRIAA